MHWVLQFQNGLCTLALQPYTVHPNCHYSHAYLHIFFYIRIFQCERKKIWRVWWCFKWLLLPVSSITCCTLQLVTFFFSFRKDVFQKIWYICINSAWLLLELSWFPTQCGILVSICLPIDTSIQVHLTLQNFIISKCYEDFLYSEYMDQIWYFLWKYVLDVTNDNLGDWRVLAYSRSGEAKEIFSHES